MLEIIPDDLKQNQMILVAAVKQTGHVIKHIPPNLSACAIQSILALEHISFFRSKNQETSACDDEVNFSIK
ncbi:MAG: hypothetical protein K0U24_04810 [Gammaproteobacteria bacterium]|nr:hypothetical protein [Gammaproteobacteria bacterium]